MLINFVFLYQLLIKTKQVLQIGGCSGFVACDGEGNIARLENHSNSLLIEVRQIDYDYDDLLLLKETVIEYTGDVPVYKDFDSFYSKDLHFIESWGEYSGIIEKKFTEIQNKKQ